MKDTVIQASQQFPVVVLTGARQTGKTTLLRDCFPDYSYVSLDLPSLAAQAEEDPELFFASCRPPAIIDEVQYAPALFRHLKQQVDKQRHSMGSWILTGSQRFNLMKGVSESLAGRAAILELEGLAWKELRDLDVSILSYLDRGSFPELYRQRELDANMYYSSYMATYLERDVRQILNVGSLRDFDRFIRLLATRNAQQLDKSAVGTAVGVSAKTISAWISILEASGQISLLEPWFGNVGKRIVKTPKIYFNDTGLLCWLLGLNETKWENSPFMGSLWETLVYSEFRKLLGMQGRKGQIYYYRDNQGLEVDFLLPGSPFTAVEVKSASEIKTRNLENLYRFARIASQSAEPGLQNLQLVCIRRSEIQNTLRTADQPDIALSGISDIENL
ncbi:ATP-binding protein [Spirochaeta dissipatitropha]